MQLSDTHKYRFSLWHLADKMKTALAAAVLKTRVPVEIVEERSDNLEFLSTLL